MTYDMFAKLLAIKALRMENGSISIFDRSMVIVPTEVLLKLRETIEKRLGSEEADRLMFETGEFQTSSGSVRYLAKKKDLRPFFQQLPMTGDPSIEMGREILKLTGMGDTTICEITKDFNKVVVSTRNSPLAHEYLKTRGKSKRPVCHYLLGIVSGVLGATGQKGYVAKEISCAATGLSDECIFEFKRPK